MWGHLCSEGGAGGLDVGGGQGHQGGVRRDGGKGGGTQSGAQSPLGTDVTFKGKVVLAGRSDPASLRQPLW